jgi:RNA polymerase sigma-70 factor, ECF subfamily
VKLAHYYKVIRHDLEAERQLVLRAQTDPEAFGRIFDLHHDKIYAYVLRRTRSQDVAADVTAETFMKALRGLQLFSWRGIPISAWLYRIAGNEINMYFRKGKYAPLSLSELIDAGYEPEAPDTPSDGALMRELISVERRVQNVHDALHTLGFKYQEVIALKYMEGKTSPEIARIIGKPEGTVRSLLSRGILLIQAALSRDTQQSTPARIMESEGRGGLSAIKNIV